ncbi:hypothetical protein JCM6294_787 [Bacteroides pyogenes DSM 20611 = JCM 6294]|uniref:Uncharacterized protein n=1 Tax=Bacteroides pyogenes DSM 20611 = JCM 6294 TaxID=1121100 RepID=W4PDV0_9BACE|nr:hypothetical protein JCM6294_787 [Bacteroides pyogenes DSM 20611 = JCM 6294]
MKTCSFYQCSLKAILHYYTILHPVAKESGKLLIVSVLPKKRAFHKLLSCFFDM